MPKKLIVAYSTRLVADESLLPDSADLTPPGSMKKAETIAKWRDDMSEKLLEEARFQPYTATFDEVQIADPTLDRIMRFKFRDPDEKRPPASLAIRSWLLKHYPDAWPNTTNPRPGSLEAIFVGFNPRLFLKILGMECSLPENQKYAERGDSESVVLPLSMWYANSDHRDIEAAVKPNDYKALTWPTVFQARGLTEMAEGWDGPGNNVNQDLLLAAELASQLGFMSEES
jgi:hypothetical protein